MVTIDNHILNFADSSILYVAKKCKKTRGRAEEATPCLKEAVQEHVRQFFSVNNRIKLRIISISMPVENLFKTTPLPVENLFKTTPLPVENSCAKLRVRSFAQEFSTGWPEFSTGFAQGFAQAK